MLFLIYIYIKEEAEGNSIINNCISLQTYCKYSKSYCTKHFSLRENWIYLKVLMQLLTIKIISKYCLHLQHCLQLCLNKSDFLCPHLQLYFPCICFLFKAIHCEKFKGNASFHRLEWNFIPSFFHFFCTLVTDPRHILLKEAVSEIVLKENYFNIHKESWGLPLKRKCINVRALIDPAPLCSEESGIAPVLPSGAVIHTRKSVHQKKKIKHTPKVLLNRKDERINVHCHMLMLF